MAKPLHGVRQEALLGVGPLLSCTKVLLRHAAACNGARMTIPLTTDV